MSENILVVDDEQEIADLVALYLQNEGYTVYKYYNAKDALECISREKLDLAILDVMLSEMSGFDICQRNGEVVSAEELFREIWADEYFSKSNNTITVHIRHLREKLEDSLENPKYIKTVWGVGYKIEN